MLRRHKDTRYHYSQWVPLRRTCSSGGGVAVWYVGYFRFCGWRHVFLQRAIWRRGATAVASLQRQTWPNTSAAFLTAWRYASAGISCRRVSVCLSVTRRYCIETAVRIELFFFARPVTLCFREIRVSPKTMLLPSGTLSRTMDLENFATAHRSSATAM